MVDEEGEENKKENEEEEKEDMKRKKIYIRKASERTKGREDGTKYELQEGERDELK